MRMAGAERGDGIVFGPKAAALDKGEAVQVRMVPMQIASEVEEPTRSPARTSDRSTAAARALRTLQWIVLAAPVVGLLGAGWAHRWITDDGFIYLRVVQQIRAGNGPVFNVGERVEAFTGVLWVVLLSVADLLTPLRLEWIAVLLGLAGTAAGLALAIAGARRLWSVQASEALLVPFGAMVFAAVLPVWMFATSGLETGLTFTWVGGCLWILAAWALSPHAKMSVPRAVVLGLGWLVRPDLALFSAAFLVLVLVRPGPQHPWRARARVAAAMIGLPFAYQVFRMGYYGSVVPNTAIAKEAGSTNWERGWRYFSDFADPYWLWVPAVALLAGGYLPLGCMLARVRRWCPLWVLGTFFLCGALHATYMVAVGGDYIHARLLLPAFFAVCAPVAVVPATRPLWASLVIAAWAAAAVLWLRPPQWTTPNSFAFAYGFVLPKSPGQVTIDDYGWGDGGPSRRWYSGPGFYRQVSLLWYERVDVVLEPEVALPLAALTGVGIPSYAMGPDFHVLDVFGLADPLTAHLEIDRTMRSAGHEKPLPAPWIAARFTPPSTRPGADDFPIFFNPLIPATSGRAFDEQVTWARAALNCAPIVEITRAATAPLTARRFLDNFLRSFANARVRIPPDPQQAYSRLCGRSYGARSGPPSTRSSSSSGSSPSLGSGSGPRSRR